MNNEQLKHLRACAKQLEKSKNWENLIKFISNVNPKELISICDELLALRAGNLKTPSISASKAALEEVLQSEVDIPSCDKIKDGYAIRYSGSTFNPDLPGPKDGFIWSAQEEFMFNLRNSGEEEVNKFLKDLQAKAAIPTWDLSVELGNRESHQGTIIFRYTRLTENTQLSIF
ncbi:hypothetical protein [Taylorella equigenitalis]|uniref:Uncharacterized protein n=1 Tax=Taylorella equigenitalis (strain MCE9) TaxID=937774 RepID=A0A654KFM5_TAYEM|nr:hypothetical protein [Taylorella equigenitalis]ADU91199.1 hypothetical protein TEQUI_0247 [Taylorella equigenitalis MCE9]ASY41153.1 hypothetical protein CAV20_05690 [Taylorella equigenitalis]WDU51531.1 hypothetical protein KNO32_06080 [Taylorella equigenitalis]WDU56027.1 hypothetical protein KPH58_06070 [Taylorella equigenitalis]WEE00081.1 hypothetical protein PZB79_05760 [Taylorella equigenitalis]